MRPFASQCWRTPGASTDHKLPSAAQASASKTLSAYHCGSPKQRVTGDGSKVEEGGLALLLMVWQLGQPAYLGKRRDDTVKLTIILIPLRGPHVPTARRGSVHRVDASANPGRFTHSPRARRRCRSCSDPARGRSS